MNSEGRNLIQWSFIKSMLSLALGVTCIMYFYFIIDIQVLLSTEYILGILLFITTFKYFRVKSAIWKTKRRFAFFSRYYLSLNGIFLVVLGGITFMCYVLLHNMILASAIFFVFLSELYGFIISLVNKLHFILVEHDYIIVSKVKLKKIFVQDIKELIYRSNILIIKTKQDKTFFINFQEVEKQEELKTLLKEWLSSYNFDIPAEF